MAALHLHQLLSLLESRERKKPKQLSMDLKESCALCILLAASGRGEQGQVRVCVWGFGALPLLPIVGGGITVTCVVNTKVHSLTEAQSIAMPVSNKLAF